MTLTSVEKENWRRFAAEFTRRHQGWPLVIESAGGERGEQPEVEPVQFHGISLDHRRGVATLIMGEDPDDYFTHSIEGVRNVILESGLRRSESSIRLESNDGLVTLLHFELTNVRTLT